MDKQRKTTDGNDDASDESLSKNTRPPSGDWQEIAGVMNLVATRIDTDALAAPEKEFVPVEAPLTAVAPLQVEETAIAVDDAQIEQLVKKALVYVVDDESIIRTMMRAGFKRTGFENVKLFTDGDEVMKAIFDENGRIREMPDLIISDTEMKRMGGLALYEKIRTISETIRPLFLALSGNHNMRNKWGDVPFVEKPFSMMELVDRVFEDLKRNANRIKKN